jgi:anti-sigma regulatory factor (Ser/Thr protein kinase)
MVMMGELLQLSVRCDAFAPGFVRQAMSELPGMGWVLGDAMLVASELVTNAVRHSMCAEDEFLTVRVARDGWVRIEVLDPGASGRSAEIADRPFELGGMGLKVVEAVARRWGTERAGGGYAVWAELARSSPASR